MILRIFTILMLAASACSAGEKVWSAVILASNPKPGEEAKEPPEDLAPFASKLTKAFDYKQFEILGSATKAIDGQSERWLVPTQNFWFGATAKHVPGGYLLDIEFFHDKRRIVETKAKLGPLSPLFFRGPKHERGQIIVVFEIRP